MSDRSTASAGMPWTGPVHRVAIYWCPDRHSAAWEAGSRWVGRCADTGERLGQPAIEGLSPPQFEALTDDPRRYGWHATLKAPFRLKEGVTLTDLTERVQVLAASMEAFDMPALHVQRLKRFLALRPVSDNSPLQTVADRCVTGLQALAAPLDEADIARRRKAGLSPEEDALMLAWGYPWVLQRFRFHCSLTGPLDLPGREVDEHTIERLIDTARKEVCQTQPTRFTHLSVVVEPQAGADFRLHAQLPLGGHTTTPTGDT